MKKTLRMAAAGFALVVCTSAHGAIITGVNAISSSVTPTIETLVEGTNIFHDRDPGHRLVNIPSEWAGDADVIVTSNSDKTLADYQLEVTTSQLGIIYVGLDTRFDADQPLSWMQDQGMTGLPSTFFNTGRTIDFDEGSTFENAGDDINTAFRLWATIAPPGVYNFFEQTFGGGSNNYVIIADNKLIPEPASMSLLALGFAGFIGFARRRR